jgi:hypothetical protein
MIIASADGKMNQKKVRCGMTLHPGVALPDFG